MESVYIEVDGLSLHARVWGEGPPILLLHGWPTSSYLWRNVAPHLAGDHRVVALDLPGFGRSDKPLDRSYSYRFFDSILDGATAALGLEALGLVVHDLGGPVGLHWAVQHPERITRLALLNTLIYPRPSWAVVAFLLAARIPGLSHLLASPWGLELTMKIGTTGETTLSPELIAAVQEPFASPAARKALLASVHKLHPGGMERIAEALPGLSMPVRIIYGTRDRILPDVARTMAQVKRDMPHAELSTLPCGHFLQEDRPDELGALLQSFFSA